MKSIFKFVMFSVVFFCLCDFSPAYGQMDKLCDRP